MKQLAFILLLIFGSTVVSADQYVNGYTRSNGTYVPGYYRTSPNSTPYDNYSTKGNTNPYTGEKGYKDPYPSNSGYRNNNSSSSNYGVKY